MLFLRCGGSDPKSRVAARRVEPLVAWDGVHDATVKIVEVTVVAAPHSIPILYLESLSSFL